MKIAHVRTAALVSILLPALAGAGMPPPAPRFPSPLLFVRVEGPPGIRTRFYQPDAPPEPFQVPVSVGLRPGYVYRFEVAGLPERPERPHTVRTIYPTLEVRGTLALIPGVDPARFPVPVVFTGEDLARVQEGALVTKAVCLERPEDALVPLPAGRPFELDIPPGRDPVEEARAHGRLLLIFRFGERKVAPDELARVSIAGTVAFPGRPALGPPAAPPTLPYACWPVFDPKLGPRPPEEEVLHDGGDVGLRAGIGPDGRLGGLDPSDTVAQYKDAAGLPHVIPSNRVCLFAPRYFTARSIIAPVGYQVVQSPGKAQAVQLQEVLLSRLPSREHRQVEEVEIVNGRERASAVQARQGLIAVEQFQGLALVVGRMKGAEVVGVCQSRPPRQPRPLVLCKTADKAAVQVGEIVSFRLRYTNAGQDPITDVVISDSLTGRLEYVPGSAAADRPHVFTTQPNAAGSLVLRWELAGTVHPGQSGEVTFQARVR